MPLIIVARIAHAILAQTATIHRYSMRLYTTARSITNTSRLIIIAVFVVVKVVFILVAVVERTRNDVTGEAAWSLIFMAVVCSA